MNKKSGWQLSGDGPDVYERFIVPAYTRAWAEEMVNRACLCKGEKILDAACGTGLVARMAAEEQCSTDLIFGVDVNTVMLKKAQEIEENINWHQSDVTNMPFPDNHFNVIFCQQGLQYFPDPSLALKEMKRVLAENGRILLSVWRPIRYSPFYESLCEVLEKYVNKNSASLLSAAFNFGDYAKLKALFSTIGFNSIKINIVVKQMHYFPFDEFVMGGIMATPFFKDIQEMKESKREEMLLEITRLNQDYIDDNGLAAPLESYIVNAKK